MLLLQNIVLMVLCCLAVSLTADETTAGADKTTAPSATNSNSSVVAPLSPGPATNGSDASGVRTSNLLKSLNVDPSMIRRAMYVLIGITGVGVLYFLVRAVRMKKPQHKKKYGLLANMDLDGMESDEDETLYEAKSLRR